MNVKGLIQPVYVRTTPQILILPTPVSKNQFRSGKMFGPRGKAKFWPRGSPEAIGDLRSKVWGRLGLGSELVGIGRDEGLDGIRFG